MYVPPAFRMDDRTAIVAAIRACRLASLVTATDAGVLATPLPLLYDEGEGEHGVLYGHLARANPQGTRPVSGEALVIFMGADAYVTPSWYATKRETGKVVPTWNYVAVHAYGPVEFFDDPGRLESVVRRLTDRHEQARDAPWSVDDMPEGFLAAQLRGIIGVRIPVTRLEGKAKLSQNRPQADRAGVIDGLSDSADGADRHVAALIPR